MGGPLDNEMTHVLKNLTKYRYVIESDVIAELIKNRRPYRIHRGGPGRQLCKIEDFNKYINNKRLIKTNNSNRGIPQGSPISGLLANIALLDFDKSLKSLLGKDKAFYQRYSDDILVVCPSSRTNAIYTGIKRNLALAGLKLSSKKTEAFKKENGKLINVTGSLEPEAKSKRKKPQYLGLEWDGKQILLRPGTIAKRYRPKNKLEKYYWTYHQRAARIINNSGIARQFNRTRGNIIKKERESFDEL
jgi:hypothetical protein